MENKLIYIASPYTNASPTIVHENFVEVSKFAAKLCSKGYIAFSPITYGHTLLEYNDMPSDWSFWKNFCLSFLQRSDELWVLMLPGWEISRGVQEEINYAKENNIPVYSVSPLKNVNDIILLPYDSSAKNDKVISRFPGVPDNLIVQSIPYERDAFSTESKKGGMLFNEKS